MVDTTFVGLRASDDVVTNEKPGHWRGGILKLFPNGDAPLTALTALMPSSKVDDPHFHWWTESLPTQRAAVTGVYTDVALSSAYTSGGVAGQTVYLKMAEADVASFRVGHQVLMRDASNPTLDCGGKLVAVQLNGASSYIAVKLLEADDNGSGVDLSDCDTVWIIGNMNPEFGTRPEPITTGPTEWENYTQIFRNSLGLSRTLMETKLRTEPAYLKAKREALEKHSIEMEKALLFGIMSSNNGSNGQPERTTRGLLSFIRSGGTVEDFTLDAGTDYAGKTWIQAGDQWLDEHLEEIFRYGSDEKLAFVGSGALLAINRLAKSVGTYQMQAREAAFGIKVMQLITPFGEVALKRHPLFSYEPTTRNAMLIFEPGLLEYKYVTDTKFKADKTDNEGGGDGADGKQEEWLTEAGMEMHHPETAGWLTGLGQTNTVS